MKKALKKLWRRVKWPLLVLVGAYVALVIYRIPAVGEKQKTAETIAFIQAQHISMSDVMGSNLPPQPYAPENDATIAGLDKNNNGIRDDVELAIFKKYPNSAKIRAAELQYALALQLMITQVFNSDTWKAAAQESSRGYACVAETSPRTDLQKHLKNTDILTSEVKNLVIDSSNRQNAYDAAYNFTTSYGDLTGTECDIDLNSLPN